MPNRLAGETSPYLLQHQNNPVDWYPWGDEAFDKARKDNKPIFLSVGYSSCHWCHVMEHESFEDAEVADILNREFVSIKVDREERPDIDDAYMTAVQLSSGRGGWPMSVFLTPDREPFFAGTYLPKDPRGGHPGLIAVLGQLSGIWRGDQERVREIAGQFAFAMRQNIGNGGRSSAELSARLVDACVAAHSAEFDEDQGGFGGAPKFPPHTAIEFLLNYAISDFGDETSRNSAADMALFTLEKMALGGIHDHVGGGFHRYSTDERWLLPHFEKMLYDNALMLGNYARAAALCHEQIPELETLFSRAANGIVRWLKEEMTSPDGLFYSALDADSEGEEGKYYVWSEDEVDEILEARGPEFRKLFQFHSQGNFRDEASGETSGANIPHLIALDGDELDEDLSRLHEARASRVRPAVDDKAIVAWNGLMIAALSEAAELDLAEAALSAILASEREIGRLPHQIAKGKATGIAFLEDYAYLIDGVTALAGVKSLFEGEGAKLPGMSASDLLTHANRLLEEMSAKFQDPVSGGYFSTSEDHEELFGKSMPVFDQPLPSGNAIAAKCLIELGYEDRALALLHGIGGWMERAPMATEGLHLALMRLVAEQGAPEVASSQKVVVSMPETSLLAINGVAEGVLLFNVPEGLHVNSATPEAKWLIPTEITFEPAIGDAKYPESEDGRYAGNLEIPFMVKIEPGIGTCEVQVTVRFQACTEQECFLPAEERFVVVVRAA